MKGQKAQIITDEIIGTNARALRESTENTASQKFRRRARKVRIEQGLTQEAADTRLSYEHGFCKKMESGVSRQKVQTFYVEQLINFSNSYNVCISYLCERTNDRHLYEDKFITANEAIKNTKSRIRDLRNEHKLSQDMLNNELGFSKKAIRNIECQDRSITLDEFIKIADYFHVNLSYLCGQTEYRLPESDLGMTNPEILELKRLLNKYGKSVVKKLEPNWFE